MQHSHKEDTSDDCRNAKGQRFRFHERETAQESRDRREDGCPVCDTYSRMIDRTPHAQDRVRTYAKESWQRDCSGDT